MAASFHPPTRPQFGRRLRKAARLDRPFGMWRVDCFLGRRDDRRIISEFSRLSAPGSGRSELLSELMRRSKEASIRIVEVAPKNAAIYRGMRRRD